MRFAAALLLLANLLPAVEIKVGHPAPPLTLDHILQASPGTEADWRQLQGKAVILEFWATWCPGCREKIPHRNRLAERFAARPLRFLSITDEDIDIVTRFLNDQPIAGWVGLDLGRRNFRALRDHWAAPDGPGGCGRHCSSCDQGGSCNGLHCGSAPGRKAATREWARPWRIRCSRYPYARPARWPSRDTRRTP